MIKNGAPTRDLFDRARGAIYVKRRLRSYSNAIGAPFLAAYWADPDFDPAQRAFYYVRVLEIPTPTWLAYDSVAFDVEIPDGKPATHQQRAYTSPIWYTP